jgi:hypothetical protein
VSKHSFTTGVSFGGDEPTWEGEVQLSYSFTPTSGGFVGSQSLDPPEGPTIEDLAVTHIDGKPKGQWGPSMFTDNELEDIFLARIGDSLDDALIENANEDRAAEYERAMEMRSDR